MGIKFYCPKGHKLNVKVFLAGKRGICPHCGCKMDIPLESQRGGDAKKKTAPGVVQAAPAVTTATSQATSPTVATAPVASNPVASNPVASNPVASNPVASNPVASNPVTSNPVTSNPVTSNPVVSVPQAAPVVTAAPSDPIAEAPRALWYVRPTTGGQYGPANGDAMLGWIGEGRVNGQSLIWREGWPEWKKADGIFRQLAQPVAAATQPMAAVTAPMTAAPAVLTPSAAPATAAPTPPSAAPSASRANEPRPIVRRRKSNVPTIIAVVVMSVLVVVAVVVLIVITQR